MLELSPLLLVSLAAAALIASVLCYWAFPLTCYGKHSKVDFAEVGIQRSGTITVGAPVIFVVIEFWTHSVLF